MKLYLYTIFEPRAGRLGVALRCVWLYMCMCDYDDGDVDDDEGIISRIVRFDCVMSVRLVDCVFPVFR